MLVTCTVSWAGPRFAYEPGDVVELDDETALARIAAGLATAAPPLIEAAVLVDPTTTTIPRKPRATEEISRGRV